MRITVNRSRPAQDQSLAFTLIEVLISMAIMGIMMVSLYGGVASGFAVIGAARENLRATQIILEKMEALRLYTWDQVNSNGYIPSTFTASFYPAVASGTNGADTNAVSSPAAGTVYYGTVTITTPTSPTNYCSHLRNVQIGVTWTNGTTVRSRTMQTLVSEHGLQRYVY